MLMEDCWAKFWSQSTHWEISLRQVALRYHRETLKTKVLTVYQNQINLNSQVEYIYNNEAAKVKIRWLEDKSHLYKTI